MAAAAASPAIPGIQNSVAMRQAILRNLNIQPGKLAGFKGDATFDQNIDNLYLQGLQNDASYDSQEGTLNRTYGQNVSDAKVKQQRALQALQENAAGRGMLHSSNFVDQNSDANTDYNTYLSNQLANRNAGLQDLGRQRTNSDLAISRGTMDQERSYGDSLKDFITQQAVGSWVAETNAQKQRAAQAQMSAARPAPRTVSSQAFTPKSSGSSDQAAALRKIYDLQNIAAQKNYAAKTQTPSKNLVYFG